DPGTRDSLYATTTACSSQRPSTRRRLKDSRSPGTDDLDADRQLIRTLGSRTAAAVVVANMIGVGAFTPPGFIARDTGSPLPRLALWVGGGMIALAGALAYAELGAALPHAGGEYVYLREAYGPCIAYLSGWTSFFAGFSGALAAALLAFAGYCSVLSP